MNNLKENSMRETKKWPIRIGRSGKAFTWMSKNRSPFIRFRTGMIAGSGPMALRRSIRIRLIRTLRITGD